MALKERWKKLSPGWKAFWITLIVMLLILLPFSLGLFGAFASFLNLRGYMPLKTKWKKKLTPELQTAVKALAKTWDLDPNWICLAIYLESRWNPTAVNPSTYASGLWQALPNTAEQMGIAPLKTYTPVTQVSLLGKYLTYVRQSPGSIKSQTDLYLAIFYPAAIGKPEDWKFPDLVYKYNKSFDADASTVITKGEITNYLKALDGTVK
jgi:hypothetical protein